MLFACVQRQEKRADPRSLTAYPQAAYIPAPRVPPPDLRPRPPVERSGLRNGFAKCVSCHAVTPAFNGIGPSLAGVYGRKAGTEPTFRYSDAMRQSGLVWDAATLDKYLTKPRALVPGNKMALAGIDDPAVRAEIIAFLQRK
jgi:cytochrome c